MDFYTNLTLKVQKGRGLWSRDSISKLCDPLITGKTANVNYRYINNNKTANIKCKK